MIPVLTDQSTRGLVARLVRNHVRAHWGRLSAAAACMALAAAATAANAWLMEPVLDKVFVERDRAMLVLIPLAVMLAAAMAAVAALSPSAQKAGPARVARRLWQVYSQCVLPLEELLAMTLKLMLTLTPTPMLMPLLMQM